MTEQQPITPPPELVEQWRIAPEYASDTEKLTMVSMTTRRLREIATQAASWGSDQELEACCMWLSREVCDGWGLRQQLRAARRPKAPSLLESTVHEPFRRSPLAGPIDNLRQVSVAVSGLEPLSPCVISAARIEDSVAKAYRLARRNGKLVLQGCFQWRQGSDGGHEWRDVPIVDLEGTNG